MNLMKIEHIFVINLKDKSHRWEKFANLHPNIERFVAIDFEDYRVCEEIGLKLDPVAMADKLYFHKPWFGWCVLQSLFNLEKNYRK